MSSQAVPRFLEDKLVSNQTSVNNGMSRNAVWSFELTPCLCCERFLGRCLVLLLGVHIRCMTAAWRSNFQSSASWNSQVAVAMKMLLLNLPQFLTLVASFFPCLFWAHKYLYTSSFGNEIPLRKVMGLHKLQPRMTTLRPRENLSEIRIKSFSKLQRSWIIHESFIPFPSTYNHVFATLLKVRSPCILLKHPFWVQKGWNKDAACKLSLPTRSKIGYKGHRCATGMLRSHICHNVKAHMISN